MHTIFDWTACVNAFTPDHTRALAAERHLQELTFERLRDRGLIGVYYVPKLKTRAIAFPVCDPAGNVTRAHCRSSKRNQNGKWHWLFEPVSTNGQDPSVSALTFGKTHSAHTVHVFESQWDAIALIDKLDLWNEIDAGEVCTVATRGAQIGSRLTGLTWHKGAVLYAWPQNDSAGQKWLTDVVGALGGCYVAETPAAHKDLGEWVINGNATGSEIESALDHAALQSLPNSGLEQKLFEELLAKYEAAIVTADELEKISIKPRAPLIGQWMKEGDLGFVWGERGGGKTWLVDAIATYLSTGNDLSDWAITQAAQVLYVDGEMPSEDTRNRLSGLSSGNKGCAGSSLQKFPG